MIRGRAMKGGATYCSEHLQANDYYEKGQKIEGTWIGSACEEFGVRAGETVTSEAFNRLRQNQHATLVDSDGKPVQITARLHGENVIGSERRAFHDFTFSAPKTFSVAAVTGGMEVVRAWHRQAVMKAAKEMEHWTTYRTNRAGVMEAHQSGNFCAAWYAHDANRALEPQLHDHLVIFNMTMGEAGKNYALESKAFFDRVNYLTAIYRDELAAQAQRAGVEIVWGKHGEPQIRSLYEAGLHEHFSRRTHEAEALIERCESLFGQKLDNNQRKALVMSSRGIDPKRFEKAFALQGNGFRWNKDEILDRFISLVRTCSDGGLREITTTEVIAQQRAGLSAGNLAVLEQLSATLGGRERNVSPVDLTTISEAIAHAVTHCFERHSVCRAQDVWEEAIRHGGGAGFDVATLRAEFDRLAQNPESKLVARGDELTTTLHLGREEALVASIEHGRGTVQPANQHFIASAKLTPEQRAAVDGLVRSRDRWTALVGDAGTGKTFAASELVRAHLEAGRKVFLCAPSNSARDVLRADGQALRQRPGPLGIAAAFEGAQSLQKLLCDPVLQKEIGSGACVFLDEAGLASTLMLDELRILAERHGWRVHLQGDPKQHSSVEAGDAFRVLLRHSSIARWRLSDIRRQNPTSGLRSVVKHLAAGRMSEALLVLDAANRIVEAPEEKRLQMMAHDYVSSVEAGRSCVVVNRTHRENDAVAANIREELKARGMLGPEETIQTIRSLGWTAAQKRDLRRYQPGHVIEISIGREQGRCFTVLGVERGRGIRARSEDGEERFFSRAESSRFEPCEAHPCEVAVGEHILLRSGQKMPGNELINGDRLVVTRLEKSAIFGRTLGADNLPAGPEKLIAIRNFTYAYASTSHRSQGMTVDVALVGLDRVSVANVDAKTLYVAGTRSREELRFYVESRSALMAQAGRITGERQAALEMAQKEMPKTANSQAMKPKRNVFLLQGRLQSAAHKLAVTWAHLREFAQACAIGIRLQPPRNAQNHIQRKSSSIRP